MTQPIETRETPLGTWVREAAAEYITEYVTTPLGKEAIRTSVMPNGEAVVHIPLFSYTREEAGHLAIMLQCFAETRSLVRDEPQTMKSADREYFAGEIKRDLLAAESSLMRARQTDTNGEKAIAVVALNDVRCYLGQAIYRLQQADSMVARYRERLEEESDG